MMTVTIDDAWLAARMRLIQRLAAACAAVLVVALIPSAPAVGASPPASCGPNSNSGSDPCTITTFDSFNIRIDKPFVAGGFYEYESIVFQPGDRITLNAGGCVQTGGSGDTWKRYVNPSGDNSDRFYFGTVTIHGAYDPADPIKVLDGTPLRSFLSGGVPHTFEIPSDFPAGGPTPLHLKLGYTDDVHSDNGYYRHDGDNGNDDQCAPERDGGPAWVTVSVQHGVVGPHPAVHPRAWDVVGTGRDSNLLFKNPAWGWQVNGGTPLADGDYFDCVWNSVFGDKTPCHSQATTFDHIGWDLWGAAGFGLCGEDMFTGGNPRGHENWFDVAYNGNIEFAEWSGNVFGDDDINMLLYTSNYGPEGRGGALGRTADNGQIKLEFDSDETIDYFDADPWWHTFRLAATLPWPGVPVVARQMVNTHEAVVIGLMGLDTEHNNTSEIHPVHALAVRENASGSVDPAHDRWAIFVRNWGNEGECGSQQHYLDSNKITLDLPHPSNISDTALGRPDREHSPFFGHATTVYPDIHADPGSTQVTFTLPAGADKPFVFGEVELNWAGALAAPAEPVAPMQNTLAPPDSNPAPTLQEEEGDDELEGVLEEFRDTMTAEQSQTAMALYDQFRPHVQFDTVPLTAVVSDTGRARPSAVPTVSAGPDPVALQKLKAQFRSLCAATSGNLPTQPDWCPRLNQPPVTTLTVAGGASGPNGWLTTPATATLTALDAAGSGINHTEYSFDGQTWNTYSGPFTLPDGIYTVSYRSQDNRGNVEETRQRDFKIDTVAPVVTINQPTATQYPHSGVLTLDYTVTDGPATGVGAGSGVASTKVTLDGSTTLNGHGLASGQAINLLTELRLGEHTFTVESVDNVGHARTQTVTFTIIVTPESLIDAVRYFRSTGDISSDGVENSLLAKLYAAAPLWHAGNCAAAAGIYQAFILELQAQSGQYITAWSANILIDDARYLIDHCTPA